MREAVCVLTFQRPDLLTLCLEAIRDSEPGMPLHVWADRGLDEREICNRFGATHHWTWEHKYHGNSASMLEMLKWAFHQQYERVYVIEDDALVDHTFFPWCRAAFDRHPEVFAACGWQYSPNALKGDGPDILIPWYLSVASCLSARSLSTIVPHATLDYYRDMKGYCDATFPSSAHRGSMHYEQDGLLLRVAESQHRRCVWPRRPRALHCGWYGYHQGEGRMEGTVEERVEALRLAVRNPELLGGMMRGGALPTIGRCAGCKLPLAVERQKDRVLCEKCFSVEHPECTLLGVGQYYVSEMEVRPEGDAVGRVSIAR